MSINYAILGLLSYKSLSGYDLKKIVQDSSFMPWSGNNNQIYKSLVELLDEGYVTKAVQHQESSPSKKIYSITEEGLAELKDWVLSSPEAPEFRKTFLIQLAWADQLSKEELETLLAGYENEIRMQTLLQQEKKLRGNFSPDRTGREKYLWNMIHDNLISSLNHELNWILKFRDGLSNSFEQEANNMNYQVVEKSNKRYIECFSVESPLHTEQDALDLVALCGENDTNLLMLNAVVLSEDFFKLKTGVAGKILQKFVNYHVKTAVIITGEIKIKGKFKELIMESNRGNDFRVFNNTSEAENWLLN